MTGGTGELMASNGDTLVVMGRGWDRAVQRDFGVPKAWLMHEQRTCDTCPVPPPGNPWEAASTAFPRGTESGSFFKAMTAGEIGYVAVGVELHYPELEQVPPIGASVAVSADGSTWTMNDPRAPEFLGGTMSGVAAGPAGVVAIGETALAPTVWYSSDGRSWTRLAGVISPASASIRGVASGPAGFVAVGDEGGRARAWVSPDGRSWRPAPDSAGLGDGRMQSVRWLGSEYVATGETRGGGRRRMALGRRPLLVAVRHRGDLQGGAHPVRHVDPVALRALRR